MKVYYDYNDFTSDDQAYLDMCRAIRDKYKHTMNMEIIELPSAHNKVEFEIVEYV